MNLPEQLDLNTWVVDLELNPPHSVGFLAQVFPSSQDSTFVIFTATEGDPGSRFLSIEEVLYETSFWAVDPRALCNAIINDYARCANRGSPVELTYLYGGTINGRTPLTPNMQGTH